MKAAIPAALCFVSLLYCCWRVHRSRGDFDPDKGYKVEVVVHGPDGQIIPPIARAPRRAQ